MCLTCHTSGHNRRYKRHLPKSNVTGAMVWAGSAAVMAVGFYFVIEGRKQRACVESFASSVPSPPHGVSHSACVFQDIRCVMYKPRTIYLNAFPLSIHQHLSRSGTHVCLSQSGHTCLLCTIFTACLYLRCPGRALLLGGLCACTFDPQP